jgi:WD40 repeat protein
LLCVDAFEELFTLNDESTRIRFSELLREVSDSGARVLLSMRDDFFVHCRNYPALHPIFDAVTPLTAPQGPALRRALVEPARKCGYQFEDEALVADILAEVTNERGAFPLLAFAAARLWEKRDRTERLITRKAYLEIGGVGGALAKHAEEVLAAIGRERESLVREIFRNLTTAKGTRAAQQRKELLSVFENREEASMVLQKLIDARLLTSTDSEVELVHESLLSTWPRLVRWQAQDAEGAVLRDQLRQAARAWQDRGRRDDLLWTGTTYRDLAQWRERYAGGLTATEQAFAEASRKHAGRTRRRRRIALTSLVAAAVLVAAITSSLWRQAKAGELRAEASKLLALADLKLQEDPTEALALASASLELADTEEGRVFAMKALWEAPPAIELNVDSQAVKMPAFSPDGKWLAAGGHVANALVFHEDGGPPIVLPGHETSPRGGNFVGWASKDLLVTGSMIGRQAHLWSLPDGARIRTIDFGRPSHWQVGSELLLAETLDDSVQKKGAGLLRAWSLPDGEPQAMGAVDLRKLGTSTSFFTPDGKTWLYVKDRNLYSRPLPVGTGPERLFARLGGDVADYWFTEDWLAVTDTTGETRLWTFPEGSPPREMVIPRPDTASVGMLPDRSGRWLAGNPNADLEVRIWDLAAWKASRPLALRRSSSWYSAFRSFHPTGNWVVASTSRFTRLTLWPIGRTHPSVVDGYTGFIRPLAFSPDGKWLATSWSDGRIRLWPMPGSGVNEVRVLELPERFLVASLAFDPKSRYLFAVGNRDRAWVVPLDASPPRRLEGFSEDTLLSAAAVSPSGNLVATAFYYGEGEKTLRVWDIETGELRRFQLPESPSVGTDATHAATGYERGIASIGFADDSILYTAGEGALRRWNLDTGAHDVVAATSPGYGMRGYLRAERGLAMMPAVRWGQWQDCSGAFLHDLNKGSSRQLAEFGECSSWNTQALALDASGTVAATGSIDGSVRVKRLSGGEPHLLIGHRGAIDRIEISPDLRWVATTGEDNTLRLWPMPDLSKPPLHTLPRGELLTKLRSLTNLRAVQDPSAAMGWKIEVGPFPGWKSVPTW